MESLFLVSLGLVFLLIGFWRLVSRPEAQGKTRASFALPAAAIGNLRTLAINLIAEICCSWFDRGRIIPGGVRFDADVAWVQKVKKVLATIHERFRDVEALLFNSASALSRLEDTGAVTSQAARRIGLVGLAARASGTYAGHDL